MAVEASLDNFRFLDLPKDIRLMVYDQLPAIRRHSTLSMPYTPTHNSNITLVLTVLPLTILRVSKMVHDEAYAILKLKLYQLLSRPPRLIIPAPDLFEIGSGFARFLEIIREIFSISCMVTLQSGKLLCYRPGMAYYYAGNISLIITPSLLQWTQHAGLYFGIMNNHPILVQFAADNPCPPMRTAGIQLLISRPGIGPRVCTTCFSRHLPLHHINLCNVCNSPTVDILLLGTSVRAPGPHSGLYGYDSQYLRDVLIDACWWRRGNSIMQENRGDIVELAAWEEDWQATPGVGISGVSSDGENTDDE